MSCSTLLRPYLCSIGWDYTLESITEQVGTDCYVTQIIYEPSYVKIQQYFKFCALNVSVYF